MMFGGESIFAPSRFTPAFSPEEVDRYLAAVSNYKREHGISPPSYMDGRALVRHYGYPLPTLTEMAVKRRALEEKVSAAKKRLCR